MTKQKHHLNIFNTTLCLTVNQNTGRHAVVWGVHIRESTGICPPPAYLRHLLKQAQTVMPGQMKAESHLMTVHRNVTPEKCKSIPSPVQNTNKMAKHLHKKSKEFSKCKKLIAVFR